MVTNKENLLKLGKKMTDRIPQKIGLEKLTEESPEYWGLAKVLDDDMVNIALSMKQRTPMTLGEISKSSGWTDPRLLKQSFRKWARSALSSTTGKMPITTSSMFFPCSFPAQQNS